MDKIIKIRQTPGIHLFWIWFFLYSIFNQLISTLNIKMTLMYVVLLFIMGVHYLYILLYKKNFNYDTELFFLFFLIPFYLITNSMSSSVFIVMACMIIKYYPLDKILKSTLVISFMCLIIHLLLLLVGYVHNTVLYKTTGDICNSLGFVHPNVAGNYLFGFILVLSLTVYKTKNKIEITFVNLVLLLGVYFVMRITGSRTFFITFMLYFGLTLLKNKIPHSLLKPVMLISFFLFGILTFISPYINGIYYIDDLLSGRIRIVSLFYDELTFHSFLMGSRIPDRPLDNAYIMLLMNGGVASVLFFLITFIKGIRKLPNEYTDEYFPFVTAVLLSGCGESTFSALTAYSLVFYRILYENFFLKYNVQTSCSYLSARQ